MKHVCKQEGFLVVALDPKKSYQLFSSRLSHLCKYRSVLFYRTHQRKTNAVCESCENE